MPSCFDTPSNINASIWLKVEFCFTTKFPVLTVKLPGEMPRNYDPSKKKGEKPDESNHDVSMWSRLAIWQDKKEGVVKRREKHHKHWDVPYFPWCCREERGGANHKTTSASHIRIYHSSLIHNIRDSRSCWVGAQPIPFSLVIMHS